jgi:nitrogen regulatory protein PII 2
MFLYQHIFRVQRQVVKCAAFNGGAVKEIIAIVRPEKWQASLETLQAMDLQGVIHRRVMGRGHQQGLQYLRRAQSAEEAGMPYLPKRMLTCLVPEEKVAEAIQALIQVNQTGNYGDGKIFVCPVEEA